MRMHADTSGAVQVMRIRSLAECSSNLAACGDAVRTRAQGPPPLQRAARFAI